MPLTRFTIIKAAPSESDYELTDEAGVVAQRKQALALRYKFYGRENLLTLPIPRHS